MIFIAWHMGLGDAIACAAIVAKIAKQNPGETITIPCWERNKISVESFFINHSNVKIEIVENDNWMVFELSHRVIIRLGVYNKSIPQNKEEDFVQWFYRQAGMDISEKEKYCPIKEASSNIEQQSTGIMNYISLYHQDDDRRFYIGHGFINCENEWPVTRQEGVSILCYKELIEKADYIHCIDSSFIHLVEAIKTNAVRVYHKYARPNSTDYKYLKGWEVIDAE